MLDFKLHAVATWVKLYIASFVEGSECVEKSVPMCASWLVLFLSSGMVIYQNNFGNYKLVILEPALILNILGRRDTF